MTTSNKTVITIAGPTAAGKTAIAVSLAQALNTEIISADSRQCYRELNIGVARPSPEELAAVPHHFIASHSIHDKVTAAVFEQYALGKTGELFQAKDVVVMVGGTGLYLKAFYEGMDEIPEVPASVHEQLVQEYELKGIQWLQQELQQQDPRFYAVGERKNPHRMMRALEVLRCTGQSITTFRKGAKQQRAFNIIRFGVAPPKEQLHRNIENRVDQMMGSGLLDEVRSLQPFQHLNALQTVGYQEIFDHLNDRCTLDQAVDAIKKNTRQYAKRQMTWFRKDKEIQWLEKPDIGEILKKIEQGPDEQGTGNDELGSI